MKVFTKGLVMLLLVAFTMASYATPIPRNQKAPPHKVLAKQILHANDVKMLKNDQVVADKNDSLIWRWMHKPVPINIRDEVPAWVTLKFRKEATKRISCNYKYKDVQKYYSCHNNLSS